MRLTTGGLLFVLIVAFASLGAMSQQRAEQPADDKEIRIGNLMFGSFGSPAIWPRAATCTRRISRSCSLPPATKS